MPEHFHLLISEPKDGKLFRAMQVLKQRVSLRCRSKRRASRQMSLWQTDLPPAFWQPRYHDFNVYSERKHIEKLRYMHRNPVKRGLVKRPEDWKWSSFRYYWFGEEGPVKIGSFKSTHPLLRAQKPKPRSPQRMGHPPDREG